MPDVLPVLEHLRAQDGQAFEVVAPYWHVTQRMRAQGIECSTLEELGIWRGEVGRSAQVWTEARLAERCIQASGHDEASRKVMAAAVRRAVTEHLGEVLWLAQSVERLLDRRRPKVLVVGNPYTPEGRTAAVVARQRGVRVAAFEHGIIHPNSPLWKGSPVDAVLLRGDVSQKALLSAGLPAGALKVTGAPRLDGALRNRSQLSLGEDACVLVATSGAGDSVTLEQHLLFIDWLYEAAATAAGPSRWRVKLHRKDRAALYSEAAGRWSQAPVEMVTSPDGEGGSEIFRFLASARVVVTVSSTVALEAMALGIPVVTAVLPGDEGRVKRLPYLASGATYRVHSAATLRETVEKLWRDGPSPQTEVAAQRCVEGYFAHRGEAVARAADALRALAGRAVDR